MAETNQPQKSIDLTDVLPPGPVWQLSQNSPPPEQPMTITNQQRPTSPPPPQPRQPK
jgi:hypothetical protein